MREVGMKEALNIIFNHVSLKKYGYFLIIKRLLFSLIYPFILVFQFVLWIFLDKSKRRDLHEKRKN